MAVSLYHLKGFAVAVNLIEKIAKIGYFLLKFEVGKEILKEFLKDFLYRLVFSSCQFDAPKLSAMCQWALIYVENF